MLRTYFFIPTSKPRFIEKMKEIKADEFVFEFEDAIAESDSCMAIKNIGLVENTAQYWVRPRLFVKRQTETGEIVSEINNVQLEKLFELGFRKFVLPKIETFEQLEEIYNVFNYYEIYDFEWILLIESPLAVCNIEKLLSNTMHPIKGIALGAQDYAAKTGMNFSYERISWARHAVLNAAYSYNVEAIDFADMNVADTETFKQQALEGFRMGYTSKLTLHPKQLEILNNLEYYSESEITEALQVAQKVDFSKPCDFSAILVEGKVYEIPNTARIEKIINYYNAKQPKL